jgi:hypothetical protein
MAPELKIENRRYGTGYELYCSECGSCHSGRVGMNFTDDSLWWYPTLIEVTYAYDLWPAHVWRVRMDHRDSNPPEWAILTIELDLDGTFEICGERKVEMLWECRLPYGHDCPHIPITEELLEIEKASRLVVVTSIAIERDLV